MYQVLQHRQHSRPFLLDIYCSDVHNQHVCLLQLLSKIGILPALPTWTDAGKVWIESHPSFPLGA